MSNKKLIIGAITGDIIGSIYEKRRVKAKMDFDLFNDNSRFTDDSVLTIATMDKLLNNKNYSESYQSYGKKYPKSGFSRTFKEWIFSEKPQPYKSCGNGSAMRVSPIGWYSNTIEEAMEEAQKSAEVSHNHIEGIKGAQAVSTAIFMARTGKSKDEIKKFIIDNFKYNLDRKIIDIRPSYKFDVTCQGSVPEAIIAFLESKDFETALRLAVYIGGDSDTIACIAGGIAEAYYKKIPANIIDFTLGKLPQEFINVIKYFSIKFRK